MVHQTACLCSTNCKMIMLLIRIIFESILIPSKRERRAKQNLHGWWCKNVSTGRKRETSSSSMCMRKQENRTSLERSLTRKEFYCFSLLVWNKSNNCSSFFYFSSAFLLFTNLNLISEPTNKKRMENGNEDKRAKFYVLFPLHFIFYYTFYIYITKQLGTR